jgi:chorismate synthase
LNSNSFGKRLVLTTFGESHGVAVGGILDGFPANFAVDIGFIQSELDRRKPGGHGHASQRRESDKLEIASGIYEGLTTGAPIAFFVYNHDHRPEDYDHLKDLYRPSHADYTWHQKFGIRDPRGGGRASARETLARVAGGAFAKLYLRRLGIEIKSRIFQIGPFRMKETEGEMWDAGSEVEIYLNTLKSEGDTAGGIIECTITGVPAGLGEPVFDKLQADLAKAMLSINAAKGFEYGAGFSAAAMRGSEHNDPFVIKDGMVTTTTNHSGGIQGGISNGQEICFRVAFKPVATLMRPQQTVSTSGENTTMEGKGRHDVCVVPRARPIVEAMAALVIADHELRHAHSHSF